jgi:hypothetical protein
MAAAQDPKDLIGEPIAVEGGYVELCSPQASSSRRIKTIPRE